MRQGYQFNEPIIFDFGKFKGREGVFIKDATMPFALVEVDGKITPEHRANFKKPAPVI